MSAYEELERRFHRLSNLRDAAAVLRWDTAAMMPRGGAEARAEQLATLDLSAHEVLTDPRTEELLAAAEDEPGLDPWQAANLREMRREWIHAAAVPADLVESLSKAASACEMTWRDARPANDFAGVLPGLKEVLALTREAASRKAERLGCTVYDALLDEWERGGRADAIDPVFDDLAAFLPGFIDEVLEHQARRPPLPRLDGPFPAAAQRELATRLMGTLGFDFEHGRLDVSHHPFCGGVPDDVRITTRYSEDDFVEGLMGVLHETGHALYERGLPARWRHQPVGRAHSTSLHESQSLLVEMQACRSREFVDFVAPLMREAFDGNGGGEAWAADGIHRIYTRVRRGLIRVDADEVTYPCHVILRYRLEKALVAGDLAVEDLPGAWREGMEGLLGLTPPDDRDGCLQDIHWFCGAWGYFPTYTLGAMTAAQLFAAVTDAVAGIPKAISTGDFAPLIGWLRTNVHAKGSLLSSKELLREVTGRPLDPEVFKAHLKRRYLS